MGPGVFRAAGTTWDTRSTMRQSFVASRDAVFRRVLGLADCLVGLSFLADFHFICLATRLAFSPAPVGAFQPVIQKSVFERQFRQEQFQTPVFFLQLFEPCARGRLRTLFAFRRRWPSELPPPAMKRGFTDAQLSAGLSDRHTGRKQQARFAKHSRCFRLGMTLAVSHPHASFRHV